MKKNLFWYLNRHPFLHKLRFFLLSEQVSNIENEKFCYNYCNKKEEIPSLYYEVNTQIFPNGRGEMTDFEVLKKIAIWLRDNIKGGRGLGFDSEKTLHLMLHDKAGVCSDFAQIVNNFCVLNDLKVREWGVIDFATHQLGHSFNEVFCKDLNKWVLIDVHKSILFFRENESVPLSVMEVFEGSQLRNDVIHYQFISPNVTEAKNIEKHYLGKIETPWVVTNYSNKIYDKYLQKLKKYPVSVVHGIILLLGRSYQFKVPKTLVKK